MDSLILSPSIESGGLNQKTITELKKRFLDVNSGRLTRARQSMLPQQKHFMDLLPFLFHINHFLMPGWIDEEVPCGISHYQPSNTTLNAAHQISRSYNYRTPSGQPAITGLFLMGSSGTVGQSSSSDLDIWLCYRSGLPPEGLFQLEQKAKRISKWARSLNLEVHFFLMDAHKFKVGIRGQMSEEHSGSTQHFLLLDEFYRSNILVAGAIPAWWLVPPYEESDYAEHIQSISAQGLMNYDQINDFGGITEIPVGEFIGAGMWQLYKGIDAPYKSVLKLLLMEVYAHSHPNVHCLSLDFKQAVYDHRLDLDELDPYVMMYRRIEHYLTERKEPLRLELVRRCLYFKINIPLSRRTRARSKNWRRELIERLVREWGWSGGHLDHLDNRDHWNIDQVLRERKALVGELTHSYRFLTQLAQRLNTPHLMRQEDMAILGRKLSAAFDRRPGKIDIINPNIAPDLSQEKLTIHQIRAEQDGHVVWGAYCNARLQEKNQKNLPLKTSSGLIEVLVWSYFNGLLDAHINIPVFSNKQSDRRLNTLSDFELKEIITSLRNLFHKPLPTVKQENFHYGARPVQTVLYVNVGRDPMGHLSARGLQKISSRTDSLDFSALRENLVMSLDLVIINSWNEVMVSRFEAGADTLVQCLQYYLAQLNRLTPDHLPSLDVLCFSQTRPAAIAQRVKELFEDIINTFYRNEALRSARYIFNVEDRYHVLQFNNERLSTVMIDGEQELLEHLGQAQPINSPILLDSKAMLDKPELRLVLYNARKNCIQLYFRKLGNGTARVFLIDEMGSLLVFVTSFYNTPTLIRPLYRFLRLVEYRQNTEHNLDENLASQLNRKMLMYEYVPPGKNNAGQLLRQKSDADIASLTFFNVQALVTKESNGSIQYQIQCYDQDFDTLTLGDQFFPTVAQYLLDQRESKEKYPVYVTEIELSDELKAALPLGRAQTVHYFHYKLRLEKRLNQALKEL